MGRGSVVGVQLVEARAAHCSLRMKDAVLPRAVPSFLAPSSSSWVSRDLPARAFSHLAKPVILTVFESLVWEFCNSSSQELGGGCLS